MHVRTSVKGCVFQWGRQIIVLYLIEARYLLMCECFVPIFSIFFLGLKPWISYCAFLCISQRRDVVTGTVEPTDEDCEWQSDREEEEELAVSQDLPLVGLWNPGPVSQLYSTCQHSGRTHSYIILMLWRPCLEVHSGANSGKVLQQSWLFCLIILLVFCQVF